MTQSVPQKNPRETLYHCVEHLLYALLSSAGDSEKQSLYKTLEHLGISQIRYLNASAEDLAGPALTPDQPLRTN